MLKTPCSHSWFPGTRARSNSQGLPTVADRGGRQPFLADHAAAVHESHIRTTTRLAIFQSKIIDFYSLKIQNAHLVCFQTLLFMKIQVSKTTCWERMVRSKKQKGLFWPASRFSCLPGCTLCCKNDAPTFHRHGPSSTNSAVRMWGWRGFSLSNLQDREVKEAY